MPYLAVSIDSVYNGPVNCGNGGYISGLLASYIEGDTEVRINATFPVETPLQVEDHDDGIGVYLDGKLLGSARPIKLELSIPPPVDLATAQAAGQHFNFIHSSDPKGCYVCSPTRSEENGLRVFCGAINPMDCGNADALEQNIVAALWRPNERLGNDGGKVDNIYVWSALDCPSAYAIKAAEPEAGLQLLGTCSGSIKTPLNTGEDYILTSWKVEPNKGRKRIMGVALHSKDGELMACARQIWIDVGNVLPSTV